MARSVSAALVASLCLTASLGCGGGGAGRTSLPATAAARACGPDVRRAVPLRVWVEPDAGEAPFVDVLSKAEKSIRVMVFQMGHGAILDALVRKARAGVAVRVILDRSSAPFDRGAFDRLTAAGARVSWSDPRFPFMHAKTIVVDDAIAVISTGNFDASQIARERNYVARDADPADVAALAALFDADWSGRAPRLSCTRLLVSPVNARERILALIESATATLDIESMELSDARVRSALVARKNAGVAIRVVLAEPGWVASNVEAAALLAQHGIPVRYLSSPAVHVKSIVVDGERAYLGSENLSATSLGRNREVGVVAHEPAVLKTMGATFEKDWAEATPF